jgi:DNA-binding MarR family transcriptional regulator
MQTLVDQHGRLRTIQDSLGLGAGTGRAKVLFMLRERPLTLSEIAEGHSVDAPYATLIVDKLESLGLVTRQPHPSDRRRKLVVLTPEGFTAAAKAEEILTAPPPVLDTLSATEIRQLDALLSRLA